MAFLHECFDSLSDGSISLRTLQELNLTKSDALNPGIKSDKNVIKQNQDQTFDMAYREGQKDEFRKQHFLNHYTSSLDNVSR